MVSIKWCSQQKKGLEIIEPNDNVAQSYLNMAEESVKIMKGVEQSKIWTVTTSYYIFYYALYAFMSKIGVKCEIHSCSLEFMKIYLGKFYDETDQEMIQKAFKARIDLQYYSDRPVDDNMIEETKKYCKEFYIKTKDKIAQVTEKERDEVRSKVLKEINPEETSN